MNIIHSILAATYSYHDSERLGEERVCGLGDGKVLVGEVAKRVTVAVGWVLMQRSASPLKVPHSDLQCKFEKTWNNYCRVLSLIFEPLIHF